MKKEKWKKTSIERQMFSDDEWVLDTSTPRSAPVNISTPRMKKHSPLHEQNVEVMRQTRTSIENAYEHPLNDNENEESEDTNSNL